MLIIIPLRPSASPSSSQTKLDWLQAERRLVSLVGCESKDSWFGYETKATALFETRGGWLVWLYARRQTRSHMVAR